MCNDFEARTRFHVSPPVSRHSSPGFTFGGRCRGRHLKNHRWFLGVLRRGRKCAKQSIHQLLSGSPFSCLHSGWKQTGGSIMLVGWEKKKHSWFLVVNCCLESGSRWVSSTLVWALGCQPCRSRLLWWTTTMVFCVNAVVFGPCSALSDRPVLLTGTERMKSDSVFGVPLLSVPLI